MKKAMMSGHELIEILIKEMASLTLCNFFTLRKEKKLSYHYKHTGVNIKLNTFQM